MLVLTETGQSKDVPVSEVNAGNYIVPKGEEHLYHAVIEVKQFDTKSGKRLSIPRVQKFGQKSFTAGQVKSNLEKQGFEIIVLHDPKLWLEKNADSMRLAAEENSKKALEAKKEKEETEKAAKEKAENDRIDAAVEKKVAEILAKQAIPAVKQKQEEKK